jgi:hypothetical protein
MEKLRLLRYRHPTKYHRNSPQNAAGRSMISPHCNVLLLMSDGRLFLDQAHMDSQSRAFETYPEANTISAGAPLRCPSPMVAQSLAVWTPFSIVGALLMAVLTVPRALLLAPSAIRTGRRA